ncbi:MAG TPA: hypothetical protein VF114_06940, partial [Candidatus Limnocylindria bacterium]
GPEGAIVFYRTDDAREVNTQFIVNPHGTGERQLTPELANAVWSPDGSWLAFAWGDWDSGKIRPAVMHPDGTGFRVLDAEPDRLIRLAPRAWSADGKHLILTTGGKDNAKLEDMGLWSIRVADAGHLRQLIGASDPADVGEMFVPSPDGTKLLHNRIWGDRPNEPDLNVLSVEFLDGSHETRISRSGSASRTRKPDPSGCMTAGRILPESQSPQEKASQLPSGDHTALAISGVSCRSPVPSGLTMNWVFTSRASSVR